MLLPRKEAQNREEGGSLTATMHERDVMPCTLACNVHSYGENGCRAVEFRPLEAEMVPMKR